MITMSCLHTQTHQNKTNKQNKPVTRGYKFILSIIFI